MDRLDGLDGFLANYYIYREYTFPIIQFNGIIINGLRYIESIFSQCLMVSPKPVQPVQPVQREP